MKVGLYFTYGSARPLLIGTGRFLLLSPIRLPTGKSRHSLGKWPMWGLQPGQSEMLIDMIPSGSAPSSR